jgi:hypothetical protein
MWKEIIKQKIKIISIAGKKYNKEKRQKGRVKKERKKERIECTKTASK